MYQLSFLLRHPVSFNVSLIIFIATTVGPLLDDGLKRGIPKALKGLSLSLLFCLSVHKLQVTIFDTGTNLFLYIL